MGYRGLVGRGLTWVWLAALAACASPTPGAGGGEGPSVVFGGAAGAGDAGAKKDGAAGKADAGKQDAGKQDAGKQDAGKQDAAGSDAAASDLGGGAPCATVEDCDDSQPCTNDSCTDGQCAHQPATAANGASACDDGNACTDDLCDATVAPGDACSHEVRAGACDDGDACTGQDKCQDGACVGKSLVCNDDDPCTEDVCNAKTGCKSTPIDDGPCDDDDACTQGEACSGGSCLGQAVDCNDNNKCTTDACDVVVGCTHQDSAEPCDDGKPCTQNDACTDGVCKGVGEDCDDKNPCTTDKCLVSSGTCQHANADGPCNDGEPCTTGETCNGGKCGGGAAKTCDDGKPCTTDSCKGGLCSNVAVTNCCVTAADCNDGKPCTSDTCVQAQCKHVVTCCANDAECSDGDAKCTSDACIGGQCSYTPTNAPGCCNPKIYKESFESGPAGWSFANSSGSVGWQVWQQAVTSQSPPAALYYGNPASQSFDFGTSKGTATSPAIAIPANAKAKLALQAWLHTEGGLPYDALVVSVIANGSATKVWDKTQPFPMTQWFAIESDLSNYAGQSIQIAIYFDTVDSIANAMTGVLIDDVAVVNSCP